MPGLTTPCQAHPDHGVSGNTRGRARYPDPIFCRTGFSRRRRSQPANPTRKPSRSDPSQAGWRERAASPQSSPGSSLSPMSGAHRVAGPEPGPSGERVACPDLDALRSRSFAPAPRVWKTPGGPTGDALIHTAVSAALIDPGISWHRPGSGPRPRYPSGPVPLQNQFLAVHPLVVCSAGGDQVVHIGGTAATPGPDVM